MLVNLEDVCEQSEMQKKKLEHEYQLEKYRRNRNIELEKAKG